MPPDHDPSTTRVHSPVIDRSADGGAGCRELEPMPFAWACRAPKGCWCSSCGDAIAEGGNCLRTQRWEFHHRHCARELGRG